MSCQMVGQTRKNATECDFVVGFKRSNTSSMSLTPTFGYGRLREVKCTNHDHRWSDMRNNFLQDRLTQQRVFPPWCLVTGSEATRPLS